MTYKNNISFEEHSVMIHLLNLIELKIEQLEESIKTNLLSGDFDLMDDNCIELYNLVKFYNSLNDFLNS